MRLLVVAGSRAAALGDDAVVLDPHDAPAARTRVALAGAVGEDAAASDRRGSARALRRACRNVSLRGMRGARLASLPCPTRRSASRSKAATAPRARDASRRPHGAFRTPAFMPVGTHGAVKALTPDQVRATGAEIVLANTYHLTLRPGEALVAKLGGLHALHALGRPDPHRQRRLPGVLAAAQGDRATAACASRTRSTAPRSI